MKPATHRGAFPVAASVTLLLCLPLVSFADPPPDYYDTVDFYGPADDEVTMDGRSMRSRVHDPGPTERDFKHFRVPPGEYTIVLTVGDLVMKRTARILADQWYDQ